MKVNEDFAKRFEHNKRRELLEKGKEKYGNLLEEDSEQEEEEEEEDDEGELINQNVETKFLETIAMIRDNDPKLKEIKDELFKDSDFEQDNTERKKKDKTFTYKDQIREDALQNREAESSDEEEGMFKKKKDQKETIAEEEERLKKEFKEAALAGNQDDEFIKRKSDDEEEVGANTIPENLEEVDLKTILTQN